ncbi:MAG: DUF5664 domain-containing protein [bacterium]|nr:DUF5664 domain-containing protein [bacterium]
MKQDHGKAMWDLLPWTAIEQVVDVMNYGATKYGEESWKGVESKRYFAAAMRHLVAYEKGEIIDKESEIHHLAHAACNVLFMLWLDDEKRSEK